MYKIITYIIISMCLPTFISAEEIKVSVGTLKISKKAKEYVNQVLDSNRLSYGPFLQKFERDFAAIHGAQFGLTSNSGTSSLQIALQAMKEIHNWQDDDEVLVPAITFVATSNIVIHCRMKPVFVDVEKEYYGIDPELIEQKINSRTRAIIPVHLFGLSCDMDPIIEISNKYNLKIIEDSCETMFVTYKNRPVGTLGDIGCFSTYVAHLLTTGVGGLSITNNKEYAIAMRSLLNHGRDSIYIGMDDNKKRGVEFKEIIEKRFSFISIGHSFRITEMEGALGLAQLEDWQPMINKRQFNAQYLTNGLKKWQAQFQLPKIRPECTHAFMMFPIVLFNEPKKNLVHYLEDNGIETRNMLPLINQPIYKKMFNIKEEDYPVAKWINDNGFYVGCHQDLTIQDLDLIIQTIDNYFERK